MTYNPQYLIMTVFSAIKKPFEIADITDISYIYLQAMNNSGMSNNYWCTEDMLVFTNTKDTLKIPTIILPSNTNKNTFLWIT